MKIRKVLCAAFAVVVNAAAADENFNVAAAVAKPGLWCEDFNSVDQSCARVIRFERPSSGPVVMRLTFLAWSDAQLFKGSLEGNAELRGKELCVKPDEVVHSLRLSYAADMLPTITVNDPPAERARLTKMTELNRQARAVIAANPAEVCGLGPFSKPLKFIPEEQVDQVTLRADE